MLEEVSQNNYDTIGEIVLPKGKSNEPYIKLNKKLLYDVSSYKHGSIAAVLLVRIIDYHRNPKHANDNTAWTKERARHYFKEMNLSKYMVDKIYKLLENLGYLRHEIIYPHAGCNRITHKYTFYASSKLNPYYDHKEEETKELKKKYVLKISTNDLLDNIKNETFISTKEIEKPKKEQKSKKENKNINYKEKIEYNHTENSAIKIAKKLYDKSIFNPLSKENNLYKINTSSSEILNYRIVANNGINNELLETSDTELLSKEGFNIILKGIMKYKESDIEDNLKHADNLINKFREYETTKFGIDALWKFRNFNRLFNIDLNKHLNDSQILNINKEEIIYPDDALNDFSDNNNLYILNDFKEDVISQRKLKNIYFMNVCYILGSYLHYMHHIGINDENTTYSSGMLSFQDINAFTKVFEKYPYLIYLPIDEVSMNLLGKLYNEQQEVFKSS